jgi:iron complex outermembrane recepter protein
MKHPLHLLFLLLPILPAAAQPADTLLLSLLDSVTVTALRLDSRVGNAPFSVSVVGREQLQEAQQQLALDEALAGVPGLFMMGSDNFTQDLRLSIRGFGARAAFGIRGIKLLVDGLPESTPDGQGQVDNIDVGLLDQAEIVRGPMAGLYGNAAGGVVSLSSEAPPEQPFAEARLSAGSFGFQRYQLKGGLTQGKLGVLAYGSHTQIDGFREHSFMRTAVFNVKADYRYREGSKLQLLFNYMDSPEALDAGALSREAVQADRRQAWAGNRNFDAGEAIQQGRVGLRWEHAWKERHQLEARAFYLWRDFNNRLPFQTGGIVQLDRQFYGGGISYSYQAKLAGLPYRFRLGLDVEQQADLRQRFNNQQGQRGERVFYQDELFRSIGAFWVQELEFSPALKAVLNARLDAVRPEARDRFLEDGDDSGRIDFTSFNPGLGLQYQAAPGLRFHANVSTSFEAPALIELSANPANPEGGGFNAALAPQRAVNYELGLGGQWGQRLRYQLTGFYIALQDELVPFELEGFPGRSFFRNAGSSRRQGLEAELRYQIASGFSAQLSYTFSDFVYQDYQLPGADLQGNRLPGIPAHFGFLRLRYLHRSGLLASLQGRYAGRLYVNDANTEQDDAYFALALRLSHSLGLGRLGLHPFLGINNLLDMRYSDSIRLNAFGGRYFEPAPGRHFYAGLRLRIG